MNATVPAGALALFQHRPFALYFGAQVFSSFARQISAVTIGWQMYELTDSPFMLGLVGLVQFLPMALLVFYAGDAADRYDRRRVVQACRLIEGGVAIVLAIGTYKGWLTSDWLLAAAAIFGVATAFEAPATTALLPAMSPQGRLQQATALSTSILQLATIVGPAVGGFAYAITPSLPYAIMAAGWLASFSAYIFIRLERELGKAPPRSFAALFAGLRFVKNDPAILGTISLDLFAVLLGGATALSPLGPRRAAGRSSRRRAPDERLSHPAPDPRQDRPAHVPGRHRLRRGDGRFRRVAMAGPVAGRAGREGAADMISVVVRASLVQLRTPDDMRGRVGAVNFLFIMASSQVGDFRSGMMAALIGPVGSVLVGGIGSIAVALLWMRLFPSIRNIERLE